MKTELERCKEALAVASSYLRGAADLHPLVQIKRVTEGADRALQEIDAILNPPPVYEDMEVESWANFTPDGRLYHSGLSQVEAESCSARDGLHAVKLTGTYKRPVPQPVERSVSVERVQIYAGGTGCIYEPPHTFEKHRECHGKRGTLTFTWHEP